MPQFSVVTFGCQMNAHDSSRMEEVLVKSGYRATPRVEDADVVVLNTCSIREKAEQKLRSEVGRLGLLKRRKPELVICVAGCVAQQEGERLLKSLPQIDLVIGPDNIPELPALLASVETGGLPLVRTVFDVETPAFLAAEPSLGPALASAYVTVMKGCNERCSYCIVPHTRGPERYRASGEIIAEIQKFVESGVREITLLGQTVNSYRDPSTALAAAPGVGSSPFAHTRFPVAAEDESEFAALLRAIVRQVPALMRLRYTSPHPRHLTPSLILAHQELTVLCHHVHMPVQSGSDRVLRRMIRRYTAAEFVERTAALQEAVPGLTLSTDMIVGFPGETAEDFEASLALVHAVGFVSLFGFTYSQRPFTPALKLQDDVAAEEKSSRLARLFEVVDQNKQRHLQSLLGTSAQVLVDGPSKAGNLSGRTQRNEIVHLSAQDAALEGCGVGALLEVQVEQAFKNSLAAQVKRVLVPARPPQVRPLLAQPSSVPPAAPRRQLQVV